MKIQMAALAAAVCLSAVGARGQTLGYTPCPLAQGAVGMCGFAVGTTPTIVALAGGHRHWHLMTTPTAGLVCSRDPDVQTQGGPPGPSPVLGGVNGPSTTHVPAGQQESYPSLADAFVPGAAATTCVSDTPGTTATGSLEVN